MIAVVGGFAAGTEDSACFRGACPSEGEFEVVCPSGFWGFRHDLGTPLSQREGQDVPIDIAYDGQLDAVMAVATDPLSSCVSPTRPHWAACTRPRGGTSPRRARTRCG